ncbi:hypothetical protein ACT4MK_18165 [Bradyrhizobium barranii]|uniref:hypothetical protein n=1 Tax=Bradyrhizobium barranii TaxID=2992140 RepID=UPI004033A58D
MTWASGFFRLWILLALLWCGATVAILGIDEFKGLWRPRVSIEVEYSGGVKDEIDGSRPREELRRQIIAGANKGIEALTQKGEAAEAKKQFGQLDESADQLLKVIDDESTKRADRLQRALTVLLVPPVALLIFGVAIGWVASGFRKRAA